MTKGADGTATGFRAMELSKDCRGVVPSTDLRVTVTANREGPAMFVHEKQYYLYVSGTMGWSPTAMWATHRFYYYYYIMLRLSLQHASHHAASNVLLSTTGHRGLSLRFTD